jgi:hypothetical protein
MLIIHVIAKLDGCWYNYSADKVVQGRGSAIKCINVDNFFYPQEEFMKFGAPVVGIVLFSMLVFCGQPAWSQETPQEETRMETQPAGIDAPQPAPAEETPAVDPGEIQPVTPEEAQPATARESQAAASDESQPAVRVAETVICQDVVDRAPMGIGEVFPKETPRVFCFTRVVGAAPGSRLVHNWYHQGSLKASVNLTVGSSDYRTWSSKTMMPQWTGEWMVEILSDGGAPLGNIIFALK